MIAYSQVPAPAKTLAAADRLLAVDPNNLRGFVFEVYLRKQTAESLTEHVAKQAALDAAASYATRGLGAAKPEQMTDADFTTLKGSVAPTFYSAIATAALGKKDTPTAILNYKSEIASAPRDQTTRPGPVLQDIYQLGVAYYESTPPDYVNCTWYASRAASFAPEPYKTEFLKVATYCYKRYHGIADGFDTITAAVQTNLNPPPGFRIAPAASAAEIIAGVMKTTPDLSTLAIGDKEFILANGRPFDADKVFATLRGRSTMIPDAVVISARGKEINAAVSYDAVMSHTADFTFVLSKPPAAPPSIGSRVDLAGTYVSYTQQPLMLKMADAQVLNRPVGPNGGPQTSSDSNPGNGSYSAQNDPRGALSSGRCNWSNDFSFIRDPEMLNTLKTQNFSQKLAQGGQSIDQQISAGEAALQQITDSLPNIETAIRAISSPPLNHFNFQFDYVATCKQNRGADQGTALLAEMCQHVNVENTRYALNGTLQIMDCMTGRPIRADIGPNQDTPVVASELPPDVRSAVVPVATNSCNVHTSGDTYSPPPDPNCPNVSRPGDPKPGDKITH
jgi:hypothetical protein